MTAAIIAGFGRAEKCREVEFGKKDIRSLAPDGQQLFFCSNRPVAGIGAPKEDHDIWMCERQKGTWGPPIHLGNAVNSPRDDFFPIVTKNKTLYFNYVSFKTQEGAWTTAVNMGKGVNARGPEFGTVLSPDGKFPFFTRQAAQRVVRHADGPLTYDDYVKMHNSPDNGSSNIWWVDAKIIEELRPGKAK